MATFIVNADDFGLTSEVNEGIIKAFRRGIVTSTSLIPSGDAFFQAVLFIRDNPKIDVGIHLTLVGEKSLLNHNEIPTLVDTHGRFRKSAYNFVLDYMRNHISMNEVEMELDAQFEKIMKHGVSLSHIDSHQHIHILPKILEITIRLAEKYGIPHIRWPKEKIRFEFVYSFRKYPRLMQQITLNLFCIYSKKRIKPYSVGGFHGFFHGGEMGRSALIEILSAEENGISEIMVHPAAMRPESAMEAYSQWNYRWQEEYESLIDLNIVELIRKRGIKLVSFLDINN